MALEKNNILESVPMVAVVGPTAIGKTALSIRIAKKFNCEVIGVDSMQVYKLMDIGTAKITRQEMDGVRHHLIDIVYPDEDYDAAAFVKDAGEAALEIHNKGRTPLLVGGTGLYLKSLKQGLFDGINVPPDIKKSLRDRVKVEGVNALHEELVSIDRTSAERIHKNDISRVLRGLEIFYATGTPWSEHLTRQKTGNDDEDLRMLIIGLTCARDELYSRINLRTSMMIESGLEDEVRSLLKRGYGPDLKSMGAIGYRHMVQYIKGAWSMVEMESLLARDTRRYAKRQYTWFNKMDDLEWYDYRNTDGVIGRIEEWFCKQQEEGMLK